jgi:hypothetical protein
MSRSAKYLHQISLIIPKFWQKTWQRIPLNFYQFRVAYEIKVGMEFLKICGIPCWRNSVYTLSLLARIVQSVATRGALCSSKQLHSRTQAIYEYMSKTECVNQSPNLRTQNSGFNPGFTPFLYNKCGWWTPGWTLGLTSWDVDPVVYNWWSNLK